MTDRIYDATQELDPKVKEKLDNGVVRVQTFYYENRDLVLVAAVGVGLVLFNRRQLRKTVTKVLAKTLKESPPTITLPSTDEIFAGLEENPGMIYVAHGNRIIHFLADNNLMVTVKGEFTGWNEKQIRNLATRAMDHIVNNVTKAPFERLPIT